MSGGAIAIVVLATGAFITATLMSLTASDGDTRPKWPWLAFVVCIVALAVAS